MQVEQAIVMLKADQREIEESAFKTPPQNYEDFKQRLGMWLGIGESIRRIAAAAKLDREDD